MFSVEVYSKIRRAVLVDGMTRREAARLFGVHRNTISKMLAYPVPPGYRRKTPRVSVKLTGFTEHIDAMIEGDRTTQHAYQHVLIKGYVDRVEIICGGVRVASHARSYEREDFIADPLHYLALIERKPRALDQAAPLDKWLLSEDVHRMRWLMETRQAKEGRREFIQVLRLCEHFEQHMVEAAVSDALKLRAISFDAIKLLLLARLERKPARLDLTLYPYLPRATVTATDSRSYMQLLAPPPIPTALQVGGSA